MAYTDDAVKAKLSALNETQEGIVTVAQWIMFHRYYLYHARCDGALQLMDDLVYRRHADRTAQLWMQRLKESTPNKRLNMIYLANGRYISAILHLIIYADRLAQQRSSNNRKPAVKTNS